MYAILNATVGYATTDTIEALQQTYRYGFHHPMRDVRKQFRESLAIALRAQAERAESAMIAAALLYRPCHMLFTGKFTSQPWNSDSLIESGTYDWLTEKFDCAVAETIRLQSHVRRYLASVVGHYYGQLDDDDHCEISQNGGIMSYQASVAFARGKYFTLSLRLSRWINQANQAQWDSLDQHHCERILAELLPAISQAARLF